MRVSISIDSISGTAPGDSCCWVAMDIYVASQNEIQI